MNVVKVPLHSVCTQDRTSVRPGERDELPYLGLEGIEAGTGQFAVGDLSKTPETPQANSFMFDARHVLYGKLRPYLNKVALPDGPGKCSTEIIPLLPKSQLERRYLGYFLRSPATVSQITERSSGARMPRADMDFVLSLDIPLPPLDEQQRLVDLLSRAEGIVRLRREAQQKAAELIPAIFIDMFGDPATNPKGWPVQSLGDLLEIPLRNGVSPARSGRYVGRVLTLSAITRGRFDESAVKAALFASPISARDEVTTEDFLICRGNGNRSLVGAGCFPSRGMSEVAFPDTMIALRPIPLMLVSSYLAGIWGTAFIRQQIDSIAKTTNGTYKINQKGIEGIKIVVPPISRQLQFASLLQAIESLTLQQSEAVKKADATFDALLAQAFH